MLLIQSPSNNPVYNLATEEYLFLNYPQDVLFLYVNEPSVIIGCNQAVQNEVNYRYCEDHGIQLVRRMSGGGTVYHDKGNLNFCFITNRQEGVSPLGSLFLQPVVDALLHLNIPVTVGARKDLWINSQYKITGTASHATRKRLLNHGTLLYDTNLEHLHEALNPTQFNPDIKAIPSVRSTVINMREWMSQQKQDTLSAEEFFSLFIQTLTGYTQAVSGSSDILNRKDIDLLMKEKYQNADWTFRK